MTNQLAVALGGRIAEEILVGTDNITTGASSDLSRVQKVARAMVMNYGFSEKMGHVGWRDHLDHETHSPQTLYDIDMEVKHLSNNAYDRAKDIITTYWSEVVIIANMLIENETVSGDEIRAMLLSGK